MNSFAAIRAIRKALIEHDKIKRPTIASFEKLSNKIRSIAEDVDTAITAPKLSDT